MLTIVQAMQAIDVGWKSQRIKLSGQTLTSKDFEVLHDLMLTHINIKSLELCFCKVDESEIIKLAGRIKDYHLIGLQAARVDLTKDGAAALATAMQECSLKKIDITYNNIGDEGGVRIAEALKDCGVECLLLARNNLKHSIVRLADVLRTTPTTLKTLDISRNLMQNEGAVAMGKALPYTGLQCLLVDMNRISEEGIVALCHGVINTPSLTELSLSGNIVKSPKSISAIVKMLAESKLEHFQLNYSDIDGETLQKLAYGVKESLYLKIFELKENRLVDNAAVKNMLKIVGPHRSLKTLNLDDTGVTSTYEKEIWQKLAEYHDLRASALTIMLAAKAITRIGCKSLLQMLPLEIFRLLSGTI